MYEVFHGILREVVFEGTKKKAWFTVSAEMGCAAWQRYVTESDGRRRWTEVADFANHLHAIEVRGENLGISKWSLIKTMTDIGREAMECGSGDTTIRILEDQLERHEKIKKNFGEDHFDACFRPDTLKVLTLCYMRFGLWDEAEGSAQRVMKIAQHKQDELDTLGTLRYIKAQQGLTEEAAEIEARWISGARGELERMAGESHSSGAKVKADYEKAGMALSLGMALQRKFEKVQDVESLQAGTAEAKEGIDEAETAYRRGYLICQPYLGLEFFDVTCGNLRWNLMTLLIPLRRLQEAEELVLQLLKGIEAWQQGPLGLAKAFIALMGILLLQGRRDEAIQGWKSKETDLRNWIGDETPMVKYSGSLAERLMAMHANESRLSVETFLFDFFRGKLIHDTSI